MILHILLGMPFLFSVGIAPDNNNTEVMKHQINATRASIEPGEDGLTAMLRRYVAYNHWANEEFTDWLRNASEEQFNREIESSFTSLKETVLHIWNAEYLWLQTVKDASANNAPARNFSGSKDELLDGWLQASENFSTYVQSMSTDDLQSKRPRSRGNGYTAIADMIHHCMNHGTYHRGQLITMGRQAGLTDPPRTDFIYYVSLIEK